MSNIIISKLSLCSTNWHNTDKCIELRFGIPVELKKNSKSPWKGYQMNSDHLQIMWDRYSYKYLKGLWEYVYPDINSSIKWEILIAIGVIFGFAASLIAFRYAFVIIPEKKR